MVLAIASCGGPPKDLPPEAILVAFHFCPADQCSGVSVGPSTRKLPYQASLMDARWCVEVKFKRDGANSKAAVEVVDVAGEWAAAEPIMNADCTNFE